MIRSDYYVYTYSYPNGVPFYVGKGCGRRDKVHLYDAKAGRNQSKWAVRVIGKLLASGEQPVITRIIENIDNELACFIEEEYIDKYGRRDIGTGLLVNCTAGGDEGAKELAPATKASRDLKLINAGQKTRFGKGHTPANKGKPRSASTIEKMRANQLGKTTSDKQKAVAAKLAKARLTDIRTCPKCGKTGPLPHMKRWHFDNCVGTRKVRARVTINGKRYHLGRFSTVEEAKMAEEKARLAGVV